MLANIVQWQYRTVDLNDRPRRVSEIDLLNTAGDVGWELVAITSNRIAFFKRQIDDEPRSRNSTARAASAAG
jgi:hypothetical protein